MGLVARRKLPSEAKKSEAMEMEIEEMEEDGEYEEEWKVNVKEVEGGERTDDDGELNEERRGNSRLKKKKEKVIPTPPHKTTEHDKSEATQACCRQPCKPL